MHRRCYVSPGKLRQRPQSDMRARPSSRYGGAELQGGDLYIRDAARCGAEQARDSSAGCGWSEWGLAYIDRGEWQPSTLRVRIARLSAGRNLHTFDGAWGNSTTSQGDTEIRRAFARWYTQAAGIGTRKDDTRAAAGTRDEASSDPGLRLMSPEKDEVLQDVPEVREVPRGQPGVSVLAQDPAEPADAGAPDGGGDAAGTDGAAAAKCVCGPGRGHAAEAPARPAAAGDPIRADGGHRGAEPDGRVHGKPAATAAAGRVPVVRAPGPPDGDGLQHEAVAAA